MEPEPQGEEEDDGDPFLDSEEAEAASTRIDLLLSTEHHIDEEDDGDPFLDSSVEIGAEEADVQERGDDDDDDDVDPFASPDDSADEGARLPCFRVFAACLVGGMLQHC